MGPALYENREKPKSDELNDVEAYCLDLISRYECHGRSNRRLWKVLQSLVVVMSAITPLMILVDGVPKLMVATPASIASISAALLAIFRWRELWVVFAMTAEALKIELLKYRTRSGPHYSSPVSNEAARSAFIGRIEVLTSGEMQSWQENILNSSNGDATPN